MEEWMKENLRNNLVDLSHTFPITDILIHLRGANIFDQSDYEEVMNSAVHRDERAKRVAIIDKLLTCDSRAYWSFCHFIRLRCQKIYEELHVNPELCTVCNGQEDAQACNYCKGISIFIIILIV